MTLVGLSRHRERARFSLALGVLILCAVFSSSALAREGRPEEMERLGSSIRWVRFASMGRHLLVIVALMATCLPTAHAQVNVEPLRSQLKQSGFGARLAASASSYAGNTQGIIFGSAALMGIRADRHAGFISLSGDYARLNHVVSVAKWFGHARHNYRLADGVWWEEFGQLESDRFRRVVFRRLLGTGPRLQLFDSANFELFYGIAYMYEHSNLDSRESAAGEGAAHRCSNYAAITLRAHPKVTITSVSYIQPRFDAPRDVKVLSVTQAGFEITRTLHSRIEVTLRYDSVRPADLSRTDLELKNALELVF